MNQEHKLRSLGYQGEYDEQPIRESLGDSFLTLSRKPDGRMVASGRKVCVHTCGCPNGVTSIQTEGENEKEALSSLYEKVFGVEKKAEEAPVEVPVEVVTETPIETVENPVVTETPMEEPEVLPESPVEVVVDMPVETPVDMPVEEVKVEETPKDDVDFPVEVTETEPETVEVPAEVVDTPSEVPEEVTQDPVEEYVPEEINK